LFTKIIQANALFSKYFCGFRKAVRKQIEKKKGKKKKKPATHLYADKTGRWYKMFTLPDRLMLHR